MKVKILSILSIATGIFFCLSSYAAAAPSPTSSPTPTPVITAVCHNEFQTARFQGTSGDINTKALPFISNIDEQFLERYYNKAFYYQNPITERTPLTSGINSGRGTTHDDGNADTMFINYDLSYSNPPNYDLLENGALTSSPTCALNESCINTKTLQSSDLDGALPDNNIGACYQWCQCGIVAGNIEVHNENYTALSTEKQSYFYPGTTFWPTNGGEVSNVFWNKNDVVPYFTEGNKNEFSFGSGDPSSSKKGGQTGGNDIQVDGTDKPPFSPLTQILINYKCTEGSGSGPSCDPQTSDFKSAPGTAKHIVGISGYFCGNSTNSWNIQGLQINNNLPTTIETQLKDPENYFFSSFPKPQGTQVAIGADRESYYSHRLGHGMDIQPNPAVPFSQVLAQEGKDPGLVQSGSVAIPTVCLNLNTIHGGRDRGLIKFIPVHGYNDCNKTYSLSSDGKSLTQDTGGDHGNYFSCNFDQNKTIRSCPSGTVFDPSVQWGWPCSRPGIDNPLRQIASTPHDLQNMIYSDKPLIYPPALTSKSPKGFQVSLGNQTHCSSADSCETALGIFNTEPGSFVGTAMAYIIGFAGAIAIVLIILGGYELISSEGNPDKVKAARERITSAIIGLLFMIFSGVFLQMLGVDILNLPGFGK